MTIGGVIYIFWWINAYLQTERYSEFRNDAIQNLGKTIPLLAGSIKFFFILHNSAESNIKKKAYDTQYSQPVTHVSTNWARRSLTSEIGRDRVYSTWYGRKR